MSVAVAIPPEMVQLLVKAGMLHEAEPGNYVWTARGLYFMAAWIKFVSGDLPQQPLTPLDQLINPKSEDNNG
jgi:hypothetical protein